jgi:hypothetical protein
MDKGASWRVEVTGSEENASRQDRSHLEAQRGRNSAKSIQHWAVTRLAGLIIKRLGSANAYA